ncbi:MAG: chorismate-binding protein, partial [Propionibacteriaceae bacterium]|nr:chorismate-binding protein [Propionibacteriaceae bacterium]
SAEQIESWWAELMRDTHITNDLGEESMAGPLAFVSFPFDSSGVYEVVVPRIIIGSRGDVSWVTRWEGSDDVLSQHELTAPDGKISFSPGVTHDQWIDLVNTVIKRIHHLEVNKVVLAREEIAHIHQRLDPRFVLDHLSKDYRQTWAFCVQNLLGASPELLIRQDRGLITSRVLAGTIHGDTDPASLAQALSSSSKDLAEHEFAVASVAQALAPYCSSLHVPEMPSVLQLPNVMHLATDISGVVDQRVDRTNGGTNGDGTVLSHCSGTFGDGTVLSQCDKTVPSPFVLPSVVGLASAIHPSAAVCGAPTEKARDMIAELEPWDRGRYAAPVGWMNSRGDGEMALALRCGLMEDSQIRIFAGCGIVADSDPESEWQETVAKLLPMKQALGVVDGGPCD